ncbi:hypothetical protein [Pseudooctadecabacter sp.]|uniref:hypothetical protein n=1 Tax=Pseudooctadecabacter sp. TaxID=1966338 RepID=UPI003F6BD86C
MFQPKTVRLLVVLLLWPIAVLSQTGETAPPVIIDPVEATVVIAERVPPDILDPSIARAVDWFTEQTDRLRSGTDRAEVDLSQLETLLEEGWTDGGIDTALFRHLRSAAFNDVPPELIRFADRNWDDASELEYAITNFATEYGGLLQDVPTVTDVVPLSDSKTHIS